MGGWHDFDRLIEQERLLKEAREKYETRYHTELGLGAIRSFRTFSTNYVRELGVLVLPFYNLLVATRACLEDAVANYVYEIGSVYPNPNLSDEIPEIELSPEDLQAASTRIRFRPKIAKRFSHKPHGIKKRPKKEPPRNKNLFDFWQGSHLNEDYRLNAYTDYLCQKTKGMLTHRNDRIEPFSTSMYDGIDIRETLRHYEDKQIYVRSSRLVHGGVTSIVIIFDPDLEGSWRQYPFRQTWTRELPSDVERAFYATYPFDHKIGPDIFQAEYGGFFASYNLPGLYPIWEDPYFTHASTPAELLLLAAIEYSNEKFILYIAHEPPLSYLKRIATQMGHQVVYIPFSDLSPVMVKKIRTFHVLTARDARDFVEDYVW